MMSIYAQNEKGDFKVLKSVKTKSITLSYHKTENVPENLNSRHCHDRYEILYVIKGEGRYTAEGKEITVKPRTLVVIPPLTYHCIEIKAGITYERTVLHFDKSSVAECAREVFASVIKSETEISVYSEEALPDTALSAIDRLLRLAELPEGEAEVMSRLLLSEIFVALSLAQRDNCSFTDEELGARVIRYLNENMFTDISLDKLARRFYVSKYYICREFKRHNGISVHGYITQKRVMHAKWLIESGETASVAAAKVGFGDYSAFYRAYVKLVGTAPTATEIQKGRERS